MDIRWLADGCIELRAAGSVVVVDPPLAPSPALAAVIDRADVVAVSRRALRGDDASDRPWIDGPGEYEKAGVFVIGVRTLPARLGPTDESELNTAFVFGVDDVAVCVLGAIGHVPAESELDALGRVDVLVVRIGGEGRLAPAKAAEVVGKLAPSVVIPIHGADHGADHGAEPMDQPPAAEAEALAHFLAAMGMPDAGAVDSYRVVADRDADETTVVLLRPVLA
ncbi:MAG: MBL fold metallo-hydrolase [Ardenticatenales bacterium]